MKTLFLKLRTTTNLRESRQLQQIKPLPIPLLVTLPIVEMAVLAAVSKTPQNGHDFAAPNHSLDHWHRPHFLAVLSCIRWDWDIFPPLCFVMVIVTSNEAGGEQWVHLQAQQCDPQLTWQGSHSRELLLYFISLCDKVTWEIQKDKLKISVEKLFHAGKIDLWGDWIHWRTVSEYQNRRRSVRGRRVSYMQEFRIQQNKTSRELKPSGDGIQVMGTEKKWDWRTV